MSNTPETIYLIPGEDLDGVPAMVWCDDPAPSYANDPADAVKYVRADRIRPSNEIIEIEQLLAANRDLQDWFDDARSEVEQLRARVAELEEFAFFVQLSAERELDPDYVPPRTEAAIKVLLDEARKITGEDESCDYVNAWLLRKQAEAVEDFGQPFDLVHRMVSSRKVAEDAREYAQRLRQQDDDAEKAGGEK